MTTLDFNFYTFQSNMTQEKITRSTVLNIRRAKELVVPSTLTRCIAQLE